MDAWLGCLSIKAWGVAHVGFLAALRFAQHSFDPHSSSFHRAAL